jgi:hypothetical protein
VRGYRNDGTPKLDVTLQQLEQAISAVEKALKALELAQLINGTITDLRPTDIESIKKMTAQAIKETHVLANALQCELEERAFKDQY